MSFVFQDYVIAKHHSRWYELGSLLDHIDQIENPYGFSSNPIDAPDISYRVAKMVARAYCEKLTRKSS